MHGTMAPRTAARNAPSRDIDSSVTDPLEAEIDRLYQLPPGELVDARNALADQLRKSGDKPAAARIKALKRPTPGAWALNQVHYRHHELLARAHDQTAQLQRLHADAGLDRQQLAAAVAAQRAALQAVVDAAMRCCESADVQAGPGQQRKVYASLQAWLAGGGDEAPGRMTHDIEPSGFEAMGSFGVAALPPLPVGASAPPPPPPRAAAQPAAPRGPDPRVVKRAEELVAEREQRAREARLRTRDREGARDEALRALERARTSVGEAERALAEARARVNQRTAELTRAEASAAEAGGVQARAEQAVEQARAELQRLKTER
jgi:hypothetical protein